MRACVQLKTASERMFSSEYATIAAKRAYASTWRFAHTGGRPLGAPSHCTSWLQPNDVGINAFFDVRMHGSFCSHPTAPLQLLPPHGIHPAAHIPWVPCLQLLSLGSSPGSSKSSSSGLVEVRHAAWDPMGPHP